MLAEATFWGMPIHFDPFCFAVGVLAAIAGIAALLFIYREYISNHRFQVKLVDVSAGVIMTIYEQRERPQLTVKFRNMGLPIKDMRVSFVISFPYNPKITKTHGGSHSFGMLDTDENTKYYPQTTMLLNACEKGMIAEYCLGESPNRIAATTGISPQFDILDSIYTLLSRKHPSEIDYAKFFISIHSGKHEIAQIPLRHHPVYMKWNTWAFRINRLFERHVKVEGQSYVVTKEILPILLCPVWQVRNFLSFCKECQERVKEENKA